MLAKGQNGVYRIDNPLSASPTLTQVGVPGGINASPVFVGNRLFGIGGALPDGSYLIEWDPQTGNHLPARPDPPWPQGETIPLPYHPRRISPEALSASGVRPGNNEITEQG